MTIDKIDSGLDANKKALSGPVTREELYNLVWSEPMLKVAARYDVSSSYMARVCASLNVPRPERGYWARLAVGTAPPIPPLPDPRPGDLLVWSRDGQHVTVDRPLPRPPSKAHQKRPRSFTRQIRTHLLIDGAKPHFESGRVSHFTSHLKPAKKLLVDLIVTKTGLDKALSFANRLFSLCEECGYRVVIAPTGERYARAKVDEHETPGKSRGYSDLWSPWRCTVVYVGTVAIGLTIIEMSEEVEVRYVNGQYIRERDYVPQKRGRYSFDNTWKTTKDFATGRLRLQAYSPYPGADWIKRWDETKDRNLDGQVESIVKELERAAVSIATLVEEAERQAKLRHEQWEMQQEQRRREDAIRRAKEARKQSMVELLGIIDQWAESNRIERFFQDIEQRTESLDEDEKLKVLERLTIARELIGSTDALEHFFRWRSPDER